jgi:hypothetical protein
VLAHSKAQAKAARSSQSEQGTATCLDVPEAFRLEPVDEDQTRIHRMLRKLARAIGVGFSRFVSDNGQLTEAGSTLTEQYRKRRELAEQSAAAREEKQFVKRGNALRMALDIHRRGSILREWLSGFPAEALEYLDRCGFRERRWHVLNLWIRVPAGRELFNDFPQLAWMLASSWIFRREPVKRPFRSLRSLVRKPRAALLAWLGLPKGDGTLKLLRRMPCHHLTGQTGARLGRVLRHDLAGKWLQNLPGPLDPDILGLLAFDHPVSFQLLLAMVEETHLPPEERHPGLSLRETFSEVETWLVQHDLPAERARLAAIRSPARLRAWHDELAARIVNELDGGKRAAWIGYLEPPLAPEPWMRPMRSFEDLRSEGLVMSHCVATRAPRITRGRTYIYAVLHPAGRATLAIKRVKYQPHWIIDELRGPGNQSVPHQVKAALKIWIERENKACDLIQR